MFKFSKKKQIDKKDEESHSGFNELITDFDEEAYLEVNPDVKEGIASGQFRDALHHLEAFGFEEIKKGLRRYDKNIEQEKVIAILGVPRSGLTLMASLLGGNCNATTWFLPYGTRKNFGLEPFTDFTSVKKAYAETFPKEEAIKNTLFISESTADEMGIDFIVESLKNLEKNGVEVHILWLTRDINHTYVSQMETAFKYWGADQLIYDDNTYKTYVNFAKNSYLKITEEANFFDTSLIAYERFVEEPLESINAIFEWLNINADIDDLVFKCDHVAGDPSFQSDIVHRDRSVIREETWLEIDELFESLDSLSKLFVQSMKERTKSLLSVDILSPFESYKEMLWEKYFDHDYYRNHYDDIRSEGLDPIEHYKVFGWRENRNPSREFDTEWYRENTFDDGETPSFLHFLLIGRFLTETGRGIGIMENLKLIDPKKYQITDDLLLEAPKFDNPKVSIIIPQFNEHFYTMACIEAVIKHTNDVSYEIIVMDDCSPDTEAREIGKYMKNIFFHSNEENLGFLRNCNKGVEFSRGEYIMMLNNDTNVQPGWLSALVELIDPDNKIGMVGSRLVYPTGEQQDTGGIIWDDASGWNFGRLKDIFAPEYNYVREVDYLTGAAMMIWRPLWDDIGGFDELYVPAYYEDPDLCFEVRKRGYKVLYQPKSLVIHFEGITNGTDLGSGVKQYQVVNHKKFYEKWKEELEENHFSNAKEFFLARDRSKHKKHMLFIDHYLPHYDQDAGSKAAFQYLQMFVKNDIQVHFIGDNFYDYPGAPYHDALTQIGIEVLHGNWYRDHWQEWFLENGKYFDYVVLSRPHIAEKYIDVIRDASDAKVIYLGHDLHWLRERREFEIKKDDKYIENSFTWIKTELNLIHKSDVSFFFSDVEKEEIQKLYPSANVDVVPLYIYDTFEKRKRKSSERKDIMFVGGFAHAPNTDAVLWFVKKVWPEILKYLPEEKFYIIGSKVPDEVLALANENIIVTGYVDDTTLDDFYKKCKVVVAPLRFGAGIKGKVVDALYNGMPLVTTSIGSEGLTNAKTAMMVADESKKFAKSVIELYSDDVLSDEYAKNALSYCKEYFSIQMAKEKMSNIFKEFKKEVS